MRLNKKTLAITRAIGFPIGILLGVYLGIKYPKQNQMQRPENYIQNQFSELGLTFDNWDDVHNRLKTKGIDAVFADLDYDGRTDVIAYDKNIQKTRIYINRIEEEK